jgi:hypothetical protein
MGPTNIGPAASGLWKRVVPSSSISTTFALVFSAIAFIHLISKDLLGEPHLNLHSRWGDA